MAAGDFYIRRNSADTSVINIAGGADENAGWDFLERDEGGIVAYTDPNLRLGIGLYLIMYSERFFTADTTNNDRVEIQGEIHTVAGGVQGGYGQDYIRKTSGQQECIVSGHMFLQVTVANTDVFVKFYRTDNSTAGTVNRVIDSGGITIVEMDSATHSFGFYSASASEATSGTTERTLNINTNDRQDTGFSRSGTSVTVTNAGRYLVTYSLDVSETATGREVVTAYLRKNASTEITGTRGYSYMRGSDGCQDGAVTWAGIVDLAASDALDLRWVCPTSATITAAANAKLQMWAIPTAGTECIAEATTGDYNAIGPFVWDTVQFIDTGSFTSVAGTSSIAPKQSDHCLVFGTFAQSTDSGTQRAYPELKLSLASIVKSYATGGGYHRNSATSNFSVSVAGLLPDVVAGQDIEINITPLGVAGALANTKGQFSVLSLASIWTYTFPPAIVSMDDDQIDTGETGNTATGESFEATQGTGKIELWSDTVGTTKVVQTVVSWNDTTIVFDSVQGALPDGTAYLVVTSNSATVSNKYLLNLGIQPYTDTVLTLRPDHYWTLDNNYFDTGITGPVRDMTSSVVGTQTFVTTPLTSGATYSSNFIGVTSRREIVDSPNMNITITSTERTFMGWIQLLGIQQSMAAIWKEGGGVQNLAFLVGVGNILLAQMADTPGLPGNVQAWSDFRLTAGRTYFILMRYSLLDNPREFRLYIDGKIQTATDGNPMPTGSFNSHSGDVGWGAPDGTLETGGTDIAYAGMEDALLAHFATWSDNSTNTTAGGLSDTEIYKLFEFGANPSVILSGTVSAMQTQLDTYASTVRPDETLSFRIGQPTDATNFELIADNITYDPSISLQLQFTGSGILTWVNENGSSTDLTKISTVLGTGSIIIVDSIPVTVTALDAFNSSVIVGARVLLRADTGGNLPVNASVTITRSGSVATVTHTAHGLITGQKVTIKGANQAEYTGAKTITVTTVNAYTFAVTGTPTTPATGTILSTAVLIEGITDASGQITSNHRYSVDQPVEGVSRSGSTLPYYKSSKMSDTIVSSGLSITVFMISDS